MPGITGKDYATISVVLLVILPLFLIPALSDMVTTRTTLIAEWLGVGKADDLYHSVRVPANICFGTAMMTGNVLVLVWVWRTIRSPKLTLIDGMGVIAGCLLSGVALVTMFYIFFVLAVVYLIAVFYAILGLSRGKEHTEQKWIALVDRVYRLRHRRKA